MSQEMTLSNESLPFIALEAGLKIDREKNVLYGAQVAKLGEASGHGCDLDETTLDQIVALGNADPTGVRVRFGHPSACTPALGTTVGVRKNFRRDGDYVRADLHITEAAKPEYARHIFAMAEHHPEKIGNSVAINGATELRRDERGNPLKDARGHTLPPVLRVKRLNAVDVVESPAAGDGMFAAPVDGVDLSPRTVLELRNALEKPGFLTRVKEVVTGWSGLGLDADPQTGTHADAELQEFGETEEDAMSDLTLADFKTKHPEVAKEYAAELSAGHSAAVSAAREEGAAEERARIQKMLSRAKPHHFARTKAHPQGFVAHALSEGLAYEAVLEGFMDLDGKANALVLLEEASADVPVEGAAAPERELSAQDAADEALVGFAREYRARKNGGA